MLISQFAISQTILFSSKSYFKSDLYNNQITYWLFQVKFLSGFRLGKFQINHYEIVHHFTGIVLASVYKNKYIRWKSEVNKNRILIKNK